ncbi:hypothetical protein BJV78DRAFT_1219119 [Lactifluus subvellereus]|nr:hypothetical protein BJV78DRAFT_1219119 [Lactifluus subvellereus]
MPMRIWIWTGAGALPCASKTISFHKAQKSYRSTGRVFNMLNLERDGRMMRETASCTSRSNSEAWGVSWGWACEVSWGWACDVSRGWACEVSRGWACEVSRG